MSLGYIAHRYMKFFQIMHDAETACVIIIPFFFTKTYSAIYDPTGEFTLLAIFIGSFIILVGIMVWIFPAIITCGELYELKRKNATRALEKLY